MPILNDEARSMYSLPGFVNDRDMSNLFEIEQINKRFERDLSEKVLDTQEKRNLENYVD